MERDFSKIDGEEKFWLSVWALAVILFLGILISSFVYCYKKDVRMAELGYQKTMIVGSSTPFYQKVKGEKNGR